MNSATWAVLADRELELGPRPEPGAWQHWRLGRDEDVAWLIIDRKGASANTLSAEVLTELDEILGTLERDRPRGLVLRSAKPAGFIAGADVSEFRKAADAASIGKAIEGARAVVDRLAGLAFPTVAVVHGYCLGGGLEIALACRRRIAIDGARLGFPEVMLGLHPGLGGAARLSRLIDPLEAMKMMLTGRAIDARRAQKLGLVDAVTQERHVRAAAGAALEGRLREHRRRLRGLVLNSTPARHLLAPRMRKAAQERAPREHYPAPHALIDLWEQHGGSQAAMLDAEKSSFARLIATDTAQNLVRLFFLREKLKKLAAAKADIRHLHVIGAGTMGGDIAAWAAFQGLRVTLQDVQTSAMGGAIKRAAELYGKLARRKIEARDALDRLIPDPHGEGLRHADVVIEAVSEKIEVKRNVFEAIEPRLKADAVLATNTSSIPLEELRTILKAPQRLVGLHFFNPVSRMQLVEVVRHDAAAPDAVEKALAFVGALDRLPAPVKSGPGFVVNRALAPYLLEAMLMLDEGIRREAIDAAAKRFGMPLGPIELADEVGLDICLEVAGVLAAKLDRPLPKLPEWLRKKVQAGDLGRKTGKGLYDWRAGKPVRSKEAFAPLDQAATDRLILPMLNACAACLREGIAEDDEIIDAAMVFGAGFAPFRGGPLHYAKTRGTAEVVAALRALAEKLGERFTPDAGWNAL